jgi:hypothetical protein
MSSINRVMNMTQKQTVAVIGAGALKPPPRFSVHDR